jgi:hypothetical protein
MEVFIVMEFNICFDHHYGYNENLLSVWGSFNEAKAHILKLYPDDVQEEGEVYKRPNVCDCFLQIIRMNMGSTEKEILYHTFITKQ